MQFDEKSSGSNVNFFDEQDSSKPLNQEVHNRYQFVQREFRELYNDDSQLLSYEQLKKFLNERCNERFDDSYLQQIFQKANKNTNELIQLDLFCYAYAEHEQQVNKQIEKLNQEIDKYQKSQNEQERKLSEQRQKEQFNEYNIMINSKLNVSILQAQNLPVQDVDLACSAYCVALCEKQRVETQVVMNQLNPNWDEHFVFEITQGNESVRFLVFDRDTIGKDEFIGQLDIPLSFLKDQKKHQQ